MAILLQGALAAEGLVGIKMNLKEVNLAAVTALLPALRKPTISQLTEKGWVALEVIMPEKEIKKEHPRVETRRGGRHHRVPAEQDYLKSFTRIWS
jgi:ATP phosphoribosyltransferase